MVFDIYFKFYQHILQCFKSVQVCEYEWIYERVMLIAMETWKEWLLPLHDCDRSWLKESSTVKAYASLSQARCQAVTVTSLWYVLLEAAANICYIASAPPTARLTSGFADGEHILRGFAVSHLNGVSIYARKSDLLLALVFFSRVTDMFYTGNQLSVGM